MNNMGISTWLSILKGISEQLSLDISPFVKARKNKSFILSIYIYDRRDSERHLIFNYKWFWKSSKIFYKISDSDLIKIADIIKERLLRKPYIKNYVYGQELSFNEVMFKITWSKWYNGLSSMKLDNFDIKTNVKENPVIYNQFMNFYDIPWFEEYKNSQD